MLQRGRAAIGRVLPSSTAVTESFLRQCAGPTRSPNDAPEAPPQNLASAFFLKSPWPSQCWPDPTGGSPAVHMSDSPSLQASDSLSLHASRREILEHVGGQSTGRSDGRVIRSLVAGHPKAMVKDRGASALLPAQHCARPLEGTLVHRRHATAGQARHASSGAPGAKGQKDIRRADLIFQPAAQPRAPPTDHSSLRFGAQFSQHMLQVSWHQQHGWGPPVIKALEPIPMHPAAQVLHYGMSCFEGMKAYKGADGTVRLFRPDMNMQRMARSCHRLSLPAFDQGELLECIKELLRVDANWIPARDGFSMYLRPTMLACTPFLGVGPPADALFLCLLSPVGPYFPDGLRPIALFVDLENARAYPGGVGDRKVAGNYAPTIVPQVAAAQRGCSQVLYVLRDPQGAAGPGDEEDGMVGESGAMNVFFLIRKKSGSPQLELVTPPLDGLILPGVTRDSVLGLAREWGPHSSMEVSERPIRLSELKEAHKEGRLLEVFGTGTAVIVQPINRLVLASGAELSIPVDEVACSYWTNMAPGQAHLPPATGTPFSLTGRLYRALLDIQYGHVAHPWSVPVSGTSDAAGTPRL